MNASCSYGFRIVGPCTEPRRLVDWVVAFNAYVRCDARAEVERESYLSAFTFGADFRRQLESTRSPKGFDGVCWSPWLWLDLDRDDLEMARLDAARLASMIDERYRLLDDALLIFFSGGKGFHVGVPTSLWTPMPGITFHAIARKLAEGLSELAQVAVDLAVYDRVRALRAPNSRHAKTGLHKVRLTLDELRQLSANDIRAGARTPLPFGLPKNPPTNEQAITDWQAAAQRVQQQAEARERRKTATDYMPTLNRATLDLIRDGADVGDRHRLLFSSAANLAEFGCPSALAHALLTEPALDSGLPPSEVRRQIDCGLNYQPGGACHV